MNQTNIILAATIGVLLTSPAVARRHEVVVTAPSIDPDARVLVVSYRDLNLAATSDQHRLYWRVNAATETVCRDDTVLADQRCRHFAMKGARPQIERAIARATEIARNGSSSIPLAAIAIQLPQ